MKEDTKIVRAGRKPELYGGAVNPPVVHASTILAENLEDFENLSKRQPPSMAYGRRGTLPSFALEEAVAELEGGITCFTYPSGLGAIAGALLSVVESGTHILVTDSVYQPTRRLCDTLLKRLGIETEYYDPLIGEKIETLMRKNTKAIFTESPGSLTFEVQDIPAISNIAHKYEAKLLLDNTWASPLFFKPFKHGVDLSIQSATKYIVGHSDAMLGTVTTNEKSREKLQLTTWSLGYHAGPDDAYLGQRGLRTLGVRLRQHQDSGYKIATWLNEQPEIIRVMHPGLSNDAGHNIWKRDFLGASGLFGFVTEKTSRKGLEAMVNGFELFGMGASWGGYESLCTPTWPDLQRSATKWDLNGQTFRIHVGLEDPDDLIIDLRKGLDRLASSHE